jgi:uncharacterized membrane protein YwaF
MPGYMIQALIGYANNSNLKFKAFSQEHRIMLYLSIIIPIIIYYCLKNKSEEVRRFSMVYLSLAVLWTFMSKYGFSTLKNPLSWPIHLCHTAMYIVPLCLIFKLNKLYYFTFFINVMGAFLAMAIPNTSDSYIFFLLLVSYSGLTILLPSLCQYY